MGFTGVGDTASRLFREMTGRMGMSAPDPEARAAGALEEVLLHRFFSPETGAVHGIGADAKRALLDGIREICGGIPSGTSWLSHLVLVTEILKLPPVSEAPGAVIECGCWKGASTASLSLACALVGRRLTVCDSFAGLPDQETELVRNYPHIGVYGYYRAGMYEGKLDEVKGNVERFGKLEVCDFKVGFFERSLAELKQSVVFAFLDVDLTSSMRDCIRFIWPLLVDGGFVYTDDSCDMEVVRVWFDDPWWRETVGERAPGYVGSGCGLPVSPGFSSLGYARKVCHLEKSYQQVPWLHYG